jgi:hypothetical protein
MTATIDDMVDHALKHASDMLVGKAGAELLPAWLIQGAERVSIVGTPFDGDLSKEIVVAVIRKMLKDENACSYSFVSEAWMATEDVNHPIGLTPSQREDRREVVLITACDRTGGAVRAFEIKRNDEGVVSALEPMPKASEADSFSGRLFNLFDD